MSNFPIINHIDEVRKYFVDTELFGLYDKGDYWIASYLMPASFADSRYDDPIYQEFRGLCFSKETGKVIARPVQKMFNIEEKTFTMLKNLPTTGFRTMEKVDGSMCFPLPTIDGFRLLTKKGDSEVAEYANKVLRKKFQHYAAFITKCIARGITPFFEFIHPNNRIVLDYGSRESFVLLGARDWVTGEYAEDIYELAKEDGIEVINFHTFTDLKSMAKTVKDSTDLEGFVVDFGGLRVKIKSDWYFERSKVFNGVGLDFHIATMVNRGESDDVKAWIPAQKERIERIENLYNDFLGAMMSAAKSKWIALGKPTTRELSNEYKDQFTKLELTYICAYVNGRDMEKMMTFLMFKTYVYGIKRFDRLVKEAKEDYGIEYESVV